MKQWVIYSLSDPRTGDVRYVGMSSNLPRRLVDHACPKAKDKTHRAQWVRLLRGMGMSPVCTILEEGSGPGYERAERDWIALFRERRAALTNSTDGGEGAPGHVKSDELRKWLSESKKGVPRPPEVTARVIATKRLRGPSQKQLAALRLISEKNKGRRQPRHAVEARAEMLRGKSWGSHGDAVKVAVSQRFKGVPKSPEQRAKMSLAALKREAAKRNAARII